MDHPDVQPPTLDLRSDRVDIRLLVVRTVVDNPIRVGQALHPERGNDPAVRTRPSLEHPAHRRPSN